MYLTHLCLEISETSVNRTHSVILLQITLGEPIHIALRSLLWMLRYHEKYFEKALNSKKIYKSIAFWFMINISPFHQRDIPRRAAPSLGYQGLMEEQLFFHGEDERNGKQSPDCYSVIYLFMPFHLNISSLNW